jgi:hypothetical protein
MSKLDALKALPTYKKITMGRIFDRFIKDYETDCGSSDPAGWFEEKGPEILRECGKAGAELYPFTGGMGTIAFAYYMAA